MKKHTRIIRCKLLLPLITISILIIPNLASAQFSGEYTIGTGVGSDFTTLSDAIDSLNQVGISSSTTFKLKDDVYNERVQINQIQGASATDTLLITSESGNSNNVVISNNASALAENYLIKLNGCQWVTISNISFQTVSVDYSTQLILEGGASNNSVYNCNFLGSSGINALGDSLSLVYHSKDGMLENDNKYFNNRFDGGAYGIVLYGEAPNKAVNNKIAKNEFLNQATYAAVLVYQQDFSFNNNEINISGGSDAAVKISQQHSGRNHILANKIQFTSTFGGAIILSDVNFTSPTDTTFIINNRVSSNGASAVRIENSKQVFIAHNTLVSENVGHKALSIGNSDDIRIENNLLVHDQDEYPLSIAGNIVNASCKNNGFYSLNGKIASTDNGGFDNLTLWQGSTLGSTSPGLNSVSGLLPIFRNAPVDLTPYCGMPSAYRTTNVLSKFSMDANGATRPANLVWMGAAELRLPTNHTTDISGYITNESDTLKAGSIEVFADTSDKKMLDKLAMVSINNDGSYLFSNLHYAENYWFKIAPDRQIFPNYIDCYHGGHLRWDGDLPFTTTDSCAAQITNLTPRLIEPIAIGSNKISGYVGEKIYAQRRTGTEPIPGLDIILDKTPPSRTVAVTQTDFNGNYNFDNLPTGTYTVIIDYEGLPADTIYQVSLDNPGDTAAYLDYCVDTTSKIEGCYPINVASYNPQDFENIQVYPNPIQDQLVIDGLTDTFSFRIYSLDGKIVKEAYQVQDTQIVSVSELARGTYYLEVFNEKDRYTITIVK